MSTSHRIMTHRLYKATGIALAAALLLAVLAAGASAQTYNTDTVITTAVGDGTADVRVGTTANTVVTVTSTEDSSGLINCRDLDIGRTESGNSTLTGALIVEGTGQVISGATRSAIIGRGATGILTLQDSAMVSLGTMTLGRYYTSGGTGTVNINGGTLTVASSTNLTYGSGAPTYGTINQTAGEATFTSFVYVGCGYAADPGSVGQYNISGGSMSIVKASGSSNAHMILGRLAGDTTALLNITGSAASMSLEGNLDVYAGGKVTFNMDGSDNHITTIQSAAARFFAGSLLDINFFGFDPSENQTFDLITVTGTFTNLGNLALVGWDSVEGNTNKLLNSNWEVKLGGADNKTLQATYVGPVIPEPATMALLGLGLLGLAVRNRR